MADQIAGMPKKYVIVGAAAVAGVLGYAYWKNGTSGVETVGVGEPIEAAADDYESPLGNSGGNSTGNFPGNVDPDAIDTNAKWTQAAVEALEASGWERSATLTALGKYLSFKALSANEVTIVMAARAVQGEPPQGGPFPIKDALPNPTVPAPAMKAPTSLKAVSVGPTSVTLDWAAVSGAKGYKVLVNGKQNGNSVLFSGGAARYLKKGTRYTLGVAGIFGSDNKTGPVASITVTTKK